MNIYSPKAQKPEIFKKNTVKNQVTYNRKITAAGSVIEFEMKSEADEISEVKRENLVVRFFNFIRDLFYEKMKLFFDFEDRYREKSKTFDMAD